MSYSLNQQNSGIMFSAQKYQAVLAMDRWEDVYVRPWQQKVKALLGREQNLLSLGLLDQTCHLAARAPKGIHNVPINQIRGSVGRSDEFTPGFRPLKDHTRQRWISVARAWQAGQSLPPVELVQVNDTYFVIDGHHRISVARAMGQITIEANVIVWTPGTTEEQACVESVL